VGIYANHFGANKMATITPIPLKNGEVSYKAVMSKPAAYGATWQYCSSNRINIPLLKITFCFYTAWARNGSTDVCKKVLL
jgi:hypothetical protein